MANETIERHAAKMRERALTDRSRGWALRAIYRPPGSGLLTRSLTVQSEDTGWPQGINSCDTSSPWGESSRKPGHQQNEQSGENMKLTFKQKHPFVILDGLERNIARFTNLVCAIHTVMARGMYDWCVIHEATGELTDWAACIRLWKAEQLRRQAF
jgi:hypothetical protein